jgi:hypothetical protein
MLEHVDQVQEQGQQAEGEDCGDGPAGGHGIHRAKTMMFSS